MNRSFEDLQQLIPRLSKARVLVIGDIIVDHFLWGTVSRISPEAPVPVVNVQREDLLLGGSANVLRNIVSLGGQGALCGLIGADPMGRKVVDLVTSLGASTEGLVVGQRPTTVKTRVVAQGQQVVRFDREQTGIPAQQSLDALLAYLKQHVHTFDAVVVSDYAKGMINEQLMTSLHHLLHRVRKKEGRQLPLIVDPKPSNIHCFVGATVITPNHLEAMQISGIRIEDDQSLLAAARQIRKDIGCSAVLITRGEAGMALLGSDDVLVTIPTMAREIYDVTGAGDTVAATLALGLAAACSMDDSAVLANHAAGVVVGKVGTASVSTGELITALGRFCFPDPGAR
ncbi:D-glycero-beta-D-manno-heptose-7-phosphate kinase [Desulfobulbus alkaliphilus]|uniref:D-glycero-beta-D-manno-heptose-7-phosphate kinase n=1 Tax=Desulfobulbus alkaliphilus TaxID=869814 RepID=UPI0019628E29|nr:D-glycero-beta-D-manno-heptose-7-phosphate kinase [Desulfobulbus alkaliphilus]